MAIVGLTLSATRKHELSFDPDKGTPAATRFTIGTIDSTIDALINDSSVTFDNDADGRATVSQVRVSQVNLEVVRYGLKGWENFKDAEGNDIPFRTVTKRLDGRAYEVVSPDSLDRLPTQVISELAAEIRKANTLTTAEAKN